MVGTDGAGRRAPGARAMPRWTLRFVRAVDAVSFRVGRVAMYLLFALMAVLLWSSLSKVGRPALWTLETAQFVMVAYFLLGGAYALQQGAHVRMDLFYARWSPRGRSRADAVTGLGMIFYLAVMLWGGLLSAEYALGLRWTAWTPGWSPVELVWPRLGFMERSPTAWRPYMWPIKIVMCLGLLLMLLQAMALWLRDLATLRGCPMPPPPGAARGAAA